MSKIKKICLGIFIAALLMAGIFMVFKISSFKKIKPEVQARESVVDDKMTTASYEIKIDKVELVGDEEIDLAYEYPGILAEIAASENTQVKEGEPIVKFDVQELALQKKQLEAVLVQAKFYLQRVGAGVTDEDLEISKTKKEEAGNSMEGVKDSLADGLRGVYSISDDAVNAYTNSMFTNLDSDPQLVFETSAKSEIESKRKNIDNELDSFEDKVKNLDADSELKDDTDDARKVLAEVQIYLNKLAKAVNSLQASGGITEETISQWKIALSAARANLELTKKALNKSYTGMTLSQGGYYLAEKELEYKEAKARTEDVMIAQAKVNEVQSQIDVLDERIKKGTILAPFSGRVMKIWYDKNEVVPPMQKVVSFSSEQRKVLMHVLEDDISNIENGKSVTILFRALPGKSFAGKVALIKPQSMLIDGDVYYEVEVLLEDTDKSLMSGMTADAFIKAR